MVHFHPGFNFFVFLCFILIVTKTRKIKIEPQHIYTGWIYENVVHENMGTGTLTGIPVKHAFN